MELRNVVVFCLILIQICGIIAALKELGVIKSHGM
jgi:hypothetical protein